MKKPKRVLCKRSCSIGDANYKNMLVKGNWYDVVYNVNDSEDTFTIIDGSGSLHLYYIYSEDNEHLPRNYAKWFYTEKEIRKMKIRKLSECRL